MPDLDKHDNSYSNAMKYLKSCKAVDYVRVDEKPDSLFSVATADFELLVWPLKLLDLNQTEHMCLVV